ncbi:MAG: hypothetical protein ACE37E_08420 [Hyphomicrobiales bacterium]
MRIVTATSFSWLLRLMGLIIAVPVLGGCVSSIVSYEVQDHGTAFQSGVQTAVACETELGTYALPDRHLSITIEGTGPYGIKVETEDTDLLFADRSAIYCLDFLYSWFGSNQIGVDRNGGLLTRIFTKFDSQTNEIARETINAAATLASAGAAAQFARSDPNAFARSAQQARDTVVDATTVGSDTRRFTFDPFDETAARRVNGELRHFGYCVYFDNRNDPRIPSWWSTVCGHRTSHVHYSYPEEQFVQEQATARQLATRAILHRPEISHRLVVLQRTDPGDRHEPWVMVGTEHVMLPNRAPIMALGVTRGLFADADTNITFNNGILTDIDINKPSELDAFTALPIYAVNALLSIPERTFALLQNDVANRQALIDSNRELIATLRSLDSQVQADRAVASGTSGVNSVLVPVGTAQASGARSGQNCLDDDAFLLADGGIELCQTILQRGD